MHDCTKMAIPELKDLVKLPVAAEWKQLGVQLGVPTHTLDEIQANHKNSPDFAQECKRDMFNWWLNNSHDTTYERLDRGIRDIGETRLSTRQHSYGDGTRWHSYTLWRVIASVLLVIAMVSMYPQVYPPNMLPVILEEEVFVGRETELGVLTDWIRNSNVSIISIVGSPGFGKTTLAIYVGHAITEKGGIAVHYADLYEVRDINAFNEKLTYLVLGKKGRSSEDLFMWASKLKVPTLFIFDNCDELLHKNKDPFQNLMKILVRQSHFLKVVLTAKQMTSFLVSFRNFTLRELSTESAANLLQKLSNSLNRTMALEIASLVGNVPLALQVVGSLLKDIDPSIIANDLRKDPIHALSSELLPPTDRVYTSLNISYHYLSPEHQKCGRLLANFPGSFDEGAVQNILGQELVQDPSKCLRKLQYKSLLTYDTHTQRYRYHQLIKTFFIFEYKGSELLIQNEIFYKHFEDYYTELGNSCKDEAKEWFDSIDEERPNYDFLTSHSLEKCPDGVIFLAEFSLNLTQFILDTLHRCESISRNPLFKSVLAVETMKSLPDIKETLIHIITKPLPDVLHDLDQKHPLQHFFETIQTPRKLMAHFTLYVLNGDIDGAISLGIKIGQSGLANFDSNYKGIVIHAGTSVYLEMYIDLLIQLSKLEAIMQGKQRAVQALLMRYNRVTELFSFAPANDPKSQQMQIKYHSALAHNYILLGQFDHFLEQWKKIIQLKWSLAQCKKVGCTHTQLALAHFGQGDYEQSVKKMEVLLKSKSLQGNQRVRLFILLHESYMILGNVGKAAQLLTKDHYLSMFPSIKAIKATDYVNSTKLFVEYHRYQHSHSTVWLLNRKCMTISSDNYRTCFILASFYRSLGSRDATKLGRVLQQVLRHHIARRQHYLVIPWQDHEVYSSEPLSQ